MAERAPAALSPSSLPIRRHSDEIVAAVRNHLITVVIGETGSGKTTQLAQILMEAGLAGDRAIVVTQPRRVVRRARGAGG